MEIVRELVAPCTPAELFVHLDDLGAYPAWMGLIASVERAPKRADAPRRLAWNVELRAKVGPLTRSKRLRMERDERRKDERVTFVRHEVDGKDHAPWILSAALEPLEAGRDGAPRTRLTMTLHYGGRLWGGLVLQRVLDDYVARGSETLLALVSDASSSETAGPATTP